MKEIYTAPSTTMEKVALEATLLLSSMPISDTEVDEGLVKSTDWDDIWTETKEE